MFVTRRDPEALELIRHDAAHVLAEAVQELYPGTQVTIGPAIADGFYYDFARNEPFTPDDFAPIEAKMREIVARGEKFVRQEIDRDEAIRFFQDKGEKYKAEIIQDLPRDEPISLYRQGDWVDLCRGPHMRSTADVGSAFKLMKVAGAYWRGDHRNAMLSRIYGTAWRDQKELDAHLHMLEEAERRDHRRIAKEMDLFHLQEEAAGSVFWHPKGWKLYRNAEAYLRRRLEAGGYQEVRTPQLLDRVAVGTLRPLGQLSGAHVHRPRRGRGQDAGGEADELPVPCADLPAGHPLLPRAAAAAGGVRLLPSLRAVRRAARHHAGARRSPRTMRTSSAPRSRSPTRAAGSSSCCPRCIAISAFPSSASSSPTARRCGPAPMRCGTARRPRCGRPAPAPASSRSLNPGDGAFYGPKLDFVLRDAIGREWQCGTFQVDFVVPGRLGAEYVAEDGSRRTPVMLHRAILGSFERFLGVMIEHYAGRFPLWLAPVQAVVATIVSDADDYAREVAGALRAAGLQVELDLSNQKINAKVREHSLAHVPVLAVVGRKEAEQRTVALRRLGGDGTGGAAAGRGGAGVLRRRPRHPI